MAEPEDKDSFEWLDRYVRHHFGGVAVAMIKTENKEALDYLIKFVKEILEKQKIKKE